MSGWRAKAEAFLSDVTPLRLASPSLAKTAKTAKTKPEPQLWEGSVSYGSFGDGGGNTPTIADRLARLAFAAPPGISERAWRERLTHAAEFDAAWGDKARALGWSDAALYSLHPLAPLARLDGMGAAFIGLGARVAAVTADAVVLSVAPAGALQRARRPALVCAPAWETFGVLALSQTISENPAVV